ncbi:hypothetical protein CAMGR0001_0793 [Campylobacter gracilis RM3268]|uniref:Uncharacterized protein n=1 Tax=Campylobacter gracilis RM3268 TaxID=553220 RepID=C8PG00_9BACT|nr:hypothetical protein CAMGR0001_0793 [Campylobacter gracilis RM3268]
MCAIKPPMCEKNNVRRAPKMHDRIACQKTIRGRAVRFLKGGATIGAVQHGRDSRFEPRAANEACTARVNANKF